MGRTLRLVDQLLAKGRNLQRLGREREARHVLLALAGLAELPAAVAEEVQCRLAELALHQRRYPQARRHLTAALRHHPDDARYHFLLAAAADAEGAGNPERARKHYRRALALEPDRPERLSEYGLFAIREGYTTEGLKCLRRAVELAPADPEVLGQLVEALCTTGRPDEAGAALRAGMFRNARDGRFRRLWEDFQFQQLRQVQEAAQRQGVAGDEEPVILPFVRPAPAAPPQAVSDAIVRLDEASALPRPHGRQRGRRQVQ
jgi:Tfp pilus assembly protein PilF